MADKRHYWVCPECGEMDFHVWVTNAAGEPICPMLDHGEDHETRPVMEKRWLVPTTPLPVGIVVNGKRITEAS